MRVLDAACERVEASNLILGGHFALKCYVDYRQTHDVDAWWPIQLEGRERQATVAMLQEIIGRIAQADGLKMNERATGALVSLELGHSRRKKVFSVQVAERERELEPPIESPWPPLQIETLRDNLASKMEALVERGAPRDFIDARAVVERKIATLDELWQLWQQKRPETELAQAKVRTRRHLEAIAARRPLESLAKNEQERAAELRRWVQEELAPLWTP